VSKMGGMKAITLEELLARPRQLSPLANLSGPAKRRRRARKPEEAEAIIRMALARGELWIASGKLEILGPRKWRFHEGQEKVLAYLGITKDE
jgi:hypothetical protein